MIWSPSAKAEPLFPVRRFRIDLNLPNRLTLGRLGLCVLLVAALSIDFPFSRTTALVLFVVASLTDWLDGEIARRRGLITDLGKLLDPLADKILISAAFVGMIGDGYGAPMWMVVAIIAREFLITGLRIVAAQRGYIMAAEKAGKHKTISQMVFIVVSLVLASSVELEIGDSRFLDFLDDIQPWLLWIALVITVASGAVYFYKNRGLFSTGDEDDEDEEASASPVLRPAFKDWQAVVAALGRGAQTVILRKGGIAEGRAGFQVKHPRFWLLPTRFHQQGERLRPEIGDLTVDSAAGDETVKIEFFADVAGVAYLSSWEEVERLGAFHFWKPEILRERFEWGKELGLHAFVVRVHRLRHPLVLPWAKEFEGCKSWVDLPLDWEGRASDPVLSDADFTAVREKIAAQVQTLENRLS